MGYFALSGFQFFLFNIVLMPVLCVAHFLWWGSEKHMQRKPSKPIKMMWQREREEHCKQSLFWLIKASSGSLHVVGVCHFAGLWREVEEKYMHKNKHFPFALISMIV